MSNTSESPQRKVFDEFNEGFMNRDSEIIAKHLHKDFRRFTYPSSLNRPVQNREEWLGHFEMIVKFTTGFKSTTHSITEAPGKIVLHSTNEADHPLQVETRRESVYTLHFADEDGTLKIKQIDEFTDSQVYIKTMSELLKAKAEAEAKAKAEAEAKAEAK